MLKGIDPLLGPDLLHHLRAMGHGDTLAVVDRNYPAESNGARTVRLDGVDLRTALQAVLSVFPIDTFVEPAVLRMLPDDGLQAVHGPADEEIDSAEGRLVQKGALDRFAFYAEARKAYAIVATGEQLPYGCYLLTKGVVA
jgi:L-fucose mutarotase